MTRGQALFLVVLAVVVALAIGCTYLLTLPEVPR